jgi:hypothetical protein
LIPKEDKEIHSIEVVEDEDTYTLRYDSLELRIEIVRVDELRVHEEIMPPLRDEVIESLQTLGILKNPITIDRETRTVLDGMHRIAAMKALKIPYILACSVDYKDPRIEVSRWFRTLRLRGRLEEWMRRGKFYQSLESTHRKCPLLLSLEKGKFHLSKGSPEDINSRMMKNRSSVVILGRDEGYLIEEDVENVIDASWVVAEVEMRLGKMGGRIDYKTERDAYHSLMEGSADYLLFSSPISKEDIISSATTGRLFAHKTTRHIIPGRPLRVDIPVKLLSSNRELGSLNQELKRSLRPRRYICRGPGAVLNGRKYEEDLIIFQGDWA